ncbi:uncharacterized protein EKO05_0002296 [Ascochyta rabiei]|uniref:uncharacterized protein n=1 Tax=Didymella rabiei TaxID=5454 RepID=UPI002208CA0B|nr:uncharacterized protein EKO05_0002296 [Ascochyta rabiei]UPX11704.1 hypothetical protein EKO05_0002296 [Ascochyta rabiei]
MDAVFPAHQTSAGRKVGSERMLQIFHGDPYSNFMKAVDNDTGEIVAAAKWNIYKGGEVPPQPELDGDYWESKEEKEFAQCIFRGFLAPRQKVIEETDAHLVALDMLIVDPAYQGMGAGRKLVRWGLARADEMGVDAVVEGSDRGRRLYASEGFDGPHYIVPVPEKFAARRKQTYWWMRRPAPGKMATS